MNICSLEYNSSCTHSNLTHVAFSGNRTILEYDMLLIDLNNIFSGYYNIESLDYSEFKGIPLLDESISIQFRRDFLKRKEELIEFLENGKTVVIFNGNNQNVYYYNGKSVISGTGRNATTTHYKSIMHSKDFLPISYDSLVLGGSNFDLKNRKLENNIKPFINYMNARCVYGNILPDNILMTVHSSKKAVFWIQPYLNGNIIFVPDLEFKKAGKDEKIIEEKYFEFLYNLPSILSKEDVSLPEYSKDYFLPNEKGSITIIDKLEKEINAKIKKLEKDKEDLISLQANKLFFTGTGTPLEICIKDMLEDIGFDILYYDPNGVRKDIEIGYKGRIAVVEVKGVSGSATEVHVSQTVKWKMEYHIEHNIMPKGILVVNAFNNRSLEERQEYFPNQLLDFAKHQEIALLTTIQIFNIKCYLENNPDKKHEIIESIFDCIGCYDKFGDWKENIEKMIN